MSHDPSGTIDCGGVALSLQAYLRDELSPEKLRLFRRHLQECPACFAKALASDPVAIFGPLAEEDSSAKPSGFWDGFWPAIQEGISSGQDRGRFLPPARRALPLFRLPRRAAPLLALAAAAAAIVFVMVGAPWRARAPQVPPVPMAPVADGSFAPAGLEGLADEVATASGSGRRAILDEGSPLPPTVESVRTPDPANARIFSMTYYEEPAPGAPAGSSPRATELVLIVDAGIEL